MADFNKSMSAVFLSVELLFGDITNYFKFLDLKKNKKIGLSQIGKMYVVCAMMPNALSIFQFHLEVLWIRCTNIARILCVKPIFIFHQR